MKDKILVRVKSHRARAQVVGILRKQPVTWYSFHFDGYFIWVTQGEWNKISAIKGVGKARVDETKLRKCRPWRTAS